ncbi:MAG: YkgJ family cysteine cluster protein [bacterium]
MTDPATPMNEADAQDSTGGLAAFVRDATRRSIAEGLAAPRERVSLEALLGDSAELAVRLTDALRGESTLHERIACQAGCGWCCHVHVVVSAAEALRVTRFLRETRSPESLERVREKLACLDDRTRGLGREARADTRLPCALLEDFSCSVHPVRPLRCRSWSSLDVERCKVEYERPRSGNLEIENVQWEVTRAVAAGVAEGIGAAGLDGERLELTAAIRVALETPDAEARWLAGEPIFAGAEAR